MSLLALCLDVSFQTNSGSKASNGKFPSSKPMQQSPPLNLLGPCSQMPLTMSSVSSSLLNIPPRLLPSLSQSLLPPHPSSAGPIRRRISDKGYHHPISGNCNAKSFEWYIKLPDFSFQLNAEVLPSLAVMRVNQ